MPKILNSYDKSIVLPPEGSNEWFALLPGWQGWIYDDEAFFWGNNTGSIANVSVAVDYYGDWCYGGRGIPCGFNNYISVDSSRINYLANGTPYFLLTETSRSCNKPCYVFRGPRDPGDSNNSRTWYAIGWATSLEPQV